MATLVCITAPNLPDKLEITMPGMGVLELINDKIDGIPRPSEYILKGLNAISPALAPVYMLIRVLDVVVAITNCVKAIPTSIITLNPSGIFDCIEKLVESFAKLLPLIPPLAYVKMIVDIVVALRVLVDDLLSTLVAIDVEISRVANLIANAADNDDSVAYAIGECARENLNRNTAGLLEVLSVFGKMMTLIFNTMETFAPLLGSSTYNKLVKARQAFADIDVNVGASDWTPIGQLKDALFAIRFALQTVEQIGKAVLGLQFSQIAPAIPEDYTFANP